MQTDLIDLDSLLEPLSLGDQGAGTNLRVDYSAASAYQRLRDARASARAEERARDADGDSPDSQAAGWRDVLTVGQSALATQSKDLEIAAWLTEALVRTQGLQGLTSGARLMTGLCDGYWDALFPLPDEDGLEGRASPVGGLSGSSADGTIMQPLRRMPLFRRTDGSSVGLYQWEQAEQVASIDVDKREARYAAGAPDLRTLEVEAKNDKAFLTGVGRKTVEAIAAWTELDSVLGKHFGSEAPSVRKVAELLARLYQVILRLGGIPVDPDSASAHEVAGADAAGGAGGPFAPGVAGPGAAATTRDSALRDLDRIAEYFRRTEPHSPLSYTLEEAVRRGNMTLPELLAEVLPDSDVRNSMLQRLGMRPEPQ